MAMSGPFIFEGVVDPEREDGGMALIDTDDFTDEVSGLTDTLFVRLHSWDESGAHPEMTALRGKRVRITVEVIEGEP
jgi:hypothetical protein